MSTQINLNHLETVGMIQFHGSFKWLCFTMLIYFIETPPFAPYEISINLSIAPHGTEWARANRTTCSQNIHPIMATRGKSFAYVSFLEASKRNANMPCHSPWPCLDMNQPINYFLCNRFLRLPYDVVRHSTFIHLSDFDLIGSSHFRCMYSESINSH